MSITPHLWQRYRRSSIIITVDCGIGTFISDKSFLKLLKIFIQEKKKKLFIIVCRKQNFCSMHYSMSVFYIVKSAHSFDKCLNYCPVDSKYSLRYCTEFKTKYQHCHESCNRRQTTELKFYCTTNKYITIVPKIPWNINLHTILEKDPTKRSNLFLRMAFIKFLIKCGIQTNVFNESYKCKNFVAKKKKNRSAVKSKHCREHQYRCNILIISRTWCC